MGGVNGEEERWFRTAVNYSNIGTYRKVSYSDDQGVNYTEIDTSFFGNNPYLNYTYERIYWLSNKKLKFITIGEEGQGLVDLDFDIRSIYYFSDRWLAFEGSAPYEEVLVSMDEGLNWKNYQLAQPLTQGNLRFVNNQYYHTAGKFLRKFDSSFQEILN